MLLCLLKIIKSALLVHSKSAGTLKLKLPLCLRLVTSGPFCGDDSFTCLVLNFVPDCGSLFSRDFDANLYLCEEAFGLLPLNTFERLSDTLLFSAYLFVLCVTGAAALAGALHNLRYGVSQGCKMPGAEKSSTAQLQGTRPAQGACTLSSCGVVRRPQREWVPRPRVWASIPACTLGTTCPLAPCTACPFPCLHRGC